MVETKQKEETLTCPGLGIAYAALPSAWLTIWSWGSTTRRPKVGELTLLLQNWDTEGEFLPLLNRVE